MNNLALILILILSPSVAVVLYYILFRKDTSSNAPIQQSSSSKTETSVEQVNVSNQAIVIEARAKAKEIIIEAREKAAETLSQATKDADKMKKGLEEKERSLAIKETELKVKDADLSGKLEDVKQTKAKVDEKLEKLESAVKAKQEQLERISGLTREEAKKELLVLFDKELVEEKAKRLREIEEEIKKNKDTLAQEILVDAMRHGTTDYVVQYTTSRVKLPDDEIKGRIIGKEGRNIKTFEEYSGVQLDLDSSPGEVIISSFDPVRREIAKIALERLISDGRIQPARIEEVIDKTREEIEHLMYKEGDNLCHRVGVYDVPKELVQMLGKFKYRFSYGQNMIEHTLEETRIGVAIAHELKANVETVKLACLFHDIGKIVTEEEGTHVELGVDLLKKHKMPEAVVNAVAEHHEDKPFSSIESVIVALADHISGARPGARSEDYASYIKRMKDLEETAYSFDGIEKAYAISAGREVRVYVKPERVDDDSTALLAREIAKKIELEQTYPGVVKVTVIRETRISATAK